MKVSLLSVESLAYVIRQSAAHGLPCLYQFLFTQDLAAEQQAKQLIEMPGEGFVLKDEHGIPFAAFGQHRTQSSHLRRSWLLCTAEAKCHQMAIVDHIRQSHDDLTRDGVTRFETWTDHGHRFSESIEPVFIAVGYALEGVHPDVGPHGETMATWARRRATSNLAADSQSAAR